MHQAKIAALVAIGFAVIDGVRWAAIQKPSAIFGDMYGFVWVWWLICAALFAWAGVKLFREWHP